MDVALGSTNPVKVGAVERALERVDPVVTPVDVDSGVPEQPWSVAETARGAETRARRAIATTDANLGVGLEGGVARFAELAGCWLVMWGSATDGDRVERAAGPSLRLPADVATRLERGEELGPVMDDREESVGIARGAGAAGVLTDGLTDRETALAQAVAGAVGPLLAGDRDHTP